MCILWNKNINLQPIDFQINASSNTFLQFPHLCYHGFFFFGNRLQIVPKIVHNKEKKNKKTFRELCIYCTEPPQGAGKTGFPCLAVSFSSLLRYTNYWIRLLHDIKNYADLHNSLHYTNQ